jgi:leucyl-tRNA synthetase
LAPLAPHIAEEIWEKLGNAHSVVFADYPNYDESKTIQNTIEFVVQVNSKIRGKLKANFDSTQAELEQIALKDENVQKFLEGKEIKKVIFVKNKLINYII